MVKTDGKEKTEKVTAEEFITRLIRHIPDEQFKTIRHYGIYSRRSKSLSKKILTTWQQEAKKWVTKVKKTLCRQTWRERVIASGQKDPLVCPKCECYYEYKGEVCLNEHGVLEIKVALCPLTKKYLEKVVAYFTGIQEKKTKEEEKATNDKETERQLCLFGVS